MVHSLAHAFAGSSPRHSLSTCRGYLPGAGLSWQDPAGNSWEESHVLGPVRGCLWAETYSVGRSWLSRVLEEEHSGLPSSMCKDPGAGWGLCCQPSVEGEGAPWAGGGSGAPNAACFIPGLLRKPSPNPVLGRGSAGSVTFAVGPLVSCPLRWASYTDEK